jgi:hypothetical protein
MIPEHSRQISSAPISLRAQVMGSLVKKSRPIIRRGAAVFRCNNFATAQNLGAL